MITNDVMFLAFVVVQKLLWMDLHQICLGAYLKIRSKPTDIIRRLQIWSNADDTVMRMQTPLSRLLGSRSTKCKLPINGKGHIGVTFRNKKLSYRRDSARRRSFYCSGSFNIINIAHVGIENPYATSYHCIILTYTSQVIARSIRQIIAFDRRGCLLLMHSSQ